MASPYPQCLQDHLACHLNHQKWELHGTPLSYFISSLPAFEMKTTVTSKKATDMDHADGKTFIRCLVVLIDASTIANCYKAFSGLRVTFRLEAPSFKIYDISIQILPPSIVPTSILGLADSSLSPSSARISSPRLGANDLQMPNFPTGVSTSTADLAKIHKLRGCTVHYEVARL